jgi:ribosomal protein S18 acetylase RimI-like enzyme
MVEINKLDEIRWRDFRDLRLDALISDPIAFGSSYEEEAIMTEDEWKRRIKNVLFAMINDKLVGMIVFIFNNKIKTKHVANLYGVYVKKEYRRQGIGMNLLESALKVIELNGNISKIRLSVNPEQRAAVKLYEKYGFETVGKLLREYNIDNKFYDELIMEKLL